MGIIVLPLRGDAPVWGIRVIVSKSCLIQATVFSGRTPSSLVRVGLNFNPTNHSKTDSGTKSPLTTMKKFLKSFMQTMQKIIDSCTYIILESLRK